jgi:hypothetical protein
MEEGEQHIDGRKRKRDRDGQQIDEMEEGEQHEKEKKSRNNR